MNFLSSLVFQYLSRQCLAASSELLDKYRAYALAGFVVWTLIRFMDAFRAGVPSHKDRDDRLYHPPRGGILFSLQPRTITIRNLYGVGKIINLVCSEPAHSLAAYEWTCSIEWDRVAVTAISSFATTQVWFGYEWEPGKALELEVRIGHVRALRPGRDCSDAPEYAEGPLWAMLAFNIRNSARRTLNVCRYRYNQIFFVKSGFLALSDHPGVWT